MPGNLSVLRKIGVLNMLTFITHRNYVFLLEGPERGRSGAVRGRCLPIVGPKISMIVFSAWWETSLKNIQFAHSTIRKCLNCYTLIYLRGDRVSNFPPFRIGRLAFGIECN